MFRLEQIISSTKLLKHFRQVCRELDEAPQALLVTRKCGSHMVLVNAEIFQGMLSSNFEAAWKSEKRGQESF